MKDFSANVLGTINVFVHIRQENKVNAGILREELKIGEGIYIPFRQRLKAKGSSDGPGACAYRL